MYLAPVYIVPAAFADGFVAVEEAVVADHTGGAAGKVAVVVGRAAAVGKTAVVGKVVVVDRAVVGKTVAVVVVDKVVVVADRVVVVDKAVAVVDRAVVVVDKVVVAERAVVVDKVVVADNLGLVVVDRVVVDDKVVVVDNLGLVVVVDKAVVDDKVVAVGNPSLVAVGILDLVVVGRAVAVDIAVGMVAADHTEQAQVVEDPGREVVEGVVLDHSINKIECMFEHSNTSTKGDLMKRNT